jgi:O-antigen ligase
MNQKDDSLLRMKEINLLEIAWLFILMAANTFTQRNAADSLSATIDATHLLRFFLDGLAFSLIITQLNRIPRLGFNPISFFLLYIIIGITSTTWSASPIGTLAKSGEVFMGVFILIKTLNGEDSIYRLRRLINLLVAFHSLVLTYALIGFMVFPESFSYPVGGFFPRRMEMHFFSADSVSNYSAFLATTFLARYLSPDNHKKNNAYLLLYFYFVFILVLGQGRTGMGILAIGTFILFLRTRTLSTVLVSPILISGIVYFFSEPLTKLFLRGQDNEMLYSLSGRSTLWKWGWQSFLDDPLFGKGFGVGSRVVFSKTTAGFPENISTVHNGILEVLLGVGILGFIFWLASFAGGLWISGRALVRKKHLDVAISFIYIFMTTVMTLGAGGWWAKPLVVFVSAIAYLTAQRMHEKSEIGSTSLSESPIEPIFPKVRSLPRQEQI